ncbi:hypothetical protein CS8_051570 [Cupriavidus sp. 8B]
MAAIAKTGFLSEDIKRMPALFDHQSRRLQSQSFDCLGGKRPRFKREHTPELARTQMNGLGLFLHGQRTAQILTRIVQRILDTIRLWREIEHFGMLGLTARPTLKHNQLVRHRTHHFRTQILSTIASAKSRPAVMPADVNIELSTM